MTSGPLGAHSGIEELEQQGVQRAALTWVQSLKHLILDGRARGSQLGDHGHSRRRKPDHVPTPVVRIDAALQERSLAKSVHDADRVAGIDTDDRNQSLLGRFSKLRQRHEDTEMVRGQTALRQHASPKAARIGAEPSEKIARTQPQIGQLELPRPCLVRRMLIIVSRSLKSFMRHDTHTT
jgi:hypothetical protein